MSDARLHLLIERLSLVLREDLRAVATRHGLALAQLEVLHYLSVTNRFSDTLTGAVDYLGATKGTVSQSVSALVRKGLVERHVDALDGRVQHCRLTAAGHAVVGESLPAPALAGAAGADAESVLAALLARMLAARRGAGFGVCRTCVHHAADPAGARCRLLHILLTADDAGRICREHVAA